MTRTVSVSGFKFNHNINFRRLIRGHHLYKKIRSPYKEEKLAASLDD